MPTSRVKKSDSNKQKEVTAQSFKRIAKGLRVTSKMANTWWTKKQVYTSIAHIFDAEARLLRSMR